MKREFSPFSTQRIDARTGKPIETVHIDIAADMRIGRDLQRELKRSVSTWAWYAQLKEQAHAKLDALKERLEHVGAVVYDEIKTANPKLSETNAKNKVKLDERWQKANRRCLKWSMRYRMLCEICTLSKERNDNLRTLEASERKERDGAF